MGKNCFLFSDLFELKIDQKNWEKSFFFYFLGKLSDDYIWNHWLGREKIHFSDKKFYN